MTAEITSFTKLYKRLLQIDFYGNAGDPPQLDKTLRQSIKEGSSMLPHCYAESYVRSLDHSLPRLLKQVSAEQMDPETLEMLTGAVYQHKGPDGPTLPLQRLLAVVSNLYRSFLDADKRSKLAVPLTDRLPPLAMFQYHGTVGPNTLTADQVMSYTGAKVGVVSLPATMSQHPILWSTLAHETGGHDITAANAGLLPELVTGIPSCLVGFPTKGAISREQLAQLWSYWINEASADVYGMLNMGPAYVPNFAAYISAFLERIHAVPQGAPTVRTRSVFNEDDPDKALDPHPTDALRLHLAAGVTDSMAGLSQGTRDKYNRQIEELTKLLVTDDVITLTGNVMTERGRKQWIEVKAPLATMLQAARGVGAYIATTRLKALGGRSIQDIETWDDGDEARAQAIREAALGGQPIGLLGDDAQMLAGATLAVLEKPETYDEVTGILNGGLNQSFSDDPIWGLQRTEAMDVRNGDRRTAAVR